MFQRDATRSFFRFLGKVEYGILTLGASLKQTIILRCVTIIIGQGEYDLNVGGRCASLNMPICSTQRNCPISGQTASLNTAHRKSDAI